MRAEQTWRRLSAAVKAGLERLFPPEQGAFPATQRRIRLRPIDLFRIFCGFVGLIAFYYGAGGLLAHKIDDDPDFTVDPNSLLEGESIAVGLAIGLLHREIEEHGWVANDPPYLPTALLHNMASYQTGILLGIQRFSESLGQSLAARSVPSTDLEAAAERLSRRGDAWAWAWSEPLGYIGRSEEQYLDGMLALQGFNVALSDGTQRLPKDAPLLGAVLRRFADELAERATALDREAAFRPMLLSRRVGDAFYEARGLSYAALILVKGLAEDYGSIIRARTITDDWLRAEQALSRAAFLAPALITNGDADGVLLPSHPLIEGYYVLDASRALLAVADRLDE